MTTTHAIVYQQVTDDGVDEVPLLAFGGDAEYIDYRTAVCNQYEQLAVRQLDDIDEDPPIARREREGNEGDYELVYRLPDEDGRIVVQNIVRITEDERSTVEDRCSELEHVRVQPFDAVPPV